MILTRESKQLNVNEEAHILFAINACVLEIFDINRKRYGNGNKYASDVDALVSSHGQRTRLWASEQVKEKSIAI